MKALASSSASLVVPLVGNKFVKYTEIYSIIGWCPT